MLNLPNILTLARLALLPVIIWLFFMEREWGAQAAYLNFGLYVLAAITDWLDGYIARSKNLVTEFGTFLDPIADKIFVATLMILLIGFVRLPDLWMIPVIIILAREFLVSGLREYLGPKKVKMPVTKLAKWKTATQMLAIALLILGPYVHSALEAGRALLIIATLLTVITGYTYMKAGLDHMNKKA